jgi:hypothetical protein
MCTGKGTLRKKGVRQCPPPSLRRKKEKKEISYIEGKMKDIGARVGYTIL